MELVCPICNSSCKKIKSDGFAERYDCPNCRIFDLSYALISDKNSNEILKHNKHLIAGYLYEANRSYDHPVLLTSSSLKNIISDPIIPKTIMQQLNKIIIFLYKELEDYSDAFDIRDMPLSIGYARTFRELTSFFDFLTNIGYLSADIPPYYKFTFRGIQYAEQLITTNISSNDVFVAMGFRDDLLSAHNNAIKPACSKLGFNAYLVSEKEHNGDITDKIIAGIKTSKFVIADLTYGNQGAYFEAGYAQGMGLPVIRTCNQGWLEENDKNKLHFDVNHYNFIMWKTEEELKERLIDRIRATIL